MSESAGSGGGNKKRKKQEPKPQSQINKCLNEKRRRELENVYIEELAELISASFSADMSALSVKPDKCAILHETVNQIRLILSKHPQEFEENQEPSPSTSAVQQGEVTSSKTIKESLFYSSRLACSLLLEVLDGFILIISSDNSVEFVTDNITSYINFDPEEVLGKSIYNIIHHGDHNRFHSCLLRQRHWTCESSTNKNRNFILRFLLKAPEGTSAQTPSQYEEMQVSSMSITFSDLFGKSSSSRSTSPTLQSDSSCSENIQEKSSNGSFLCVAKRLTPAEKIILNSRPTSPSTIQIFTTKLEPNGKIVNLDLTGVSSTISSMLPKSHFEGRSLLDYCLTPSDAEKLSNHLEETRNSSIKLTEVTFGIRTPKPHTSGNTSLLLSTKSRLFKSDQNYSFIMATHTILGDPNDPANDRSGSASGTSNSPPPSGGLGNGSNAADTPSLLNGSFGAYDLDYELSAATAPWDGPMGEIAPPPPQPVHLHGSPQTPPSVQQTQPQAFAPFSPATGPPDAPCDPIKSEPMSVPPSDSGRLRDLLTKRERNDEANQGDITAADSRDRILKTLLNQEDDRSGTSNASGNSSTTAKQGSEMLLKLLNERSDDDDVDGRPVVKRRGDIWHHLLKDTAPKSVPVTASSSTNNSDTIMDSLRFPSPSPPNMDEELTVASLMSSTSSRKRHSEDNIDAQPETVDENGQPIKEGEESQKDKEKKELLNKNQMLVQLLSVVPQKPIIPAISPSVISETPQEKLDRQKREHMQAVSLRQALVPRPLSAGHKMQIGSSTPVTQPSRSQHLAPSPLNMLPHVAASAPSTVTTNNSLTVSNANNTNMTGNLGMNSSSDSSSGYWDASSGQTIDPLLSLILDDVIDFVPETDPPPVSDNRSGSSGIQEELNERQAINEIQKKLMLCENAVVKAAPLPCTDSTANSIVQDNTKTLPPAYNSSPVPSAQSHYGPPPQYPRSRFTTRSTPYTNLSHQLNSQQAMRSRIQQQQLQQKQRLLLQQERQQLVVGASARAPADETSHQLSMDSLLHNTVAPNVALQRSSSAPDGGQGSPTAPPYSPGFSPVSMSGAQTAQQTTAAQSRLSPNFPQQQSQTVYGGGNTSGAGAVSVSPTVPSAGSWTPQQSQPRLSLQQQQNPMLNAQLTATGYGRSFQQRQQAAYEQPPVNPGYAPPHPSSQMRGLQRTVSAPGPAGLIPGGRLYGYPGGTHSAPPPPQPQLQQPQQAQMYSHNPLTPESLQQQYGYEAARTGGPNGVTSEYVRQKLGEYVGARAQHQHTTGVRPAGQAVVGASLGIAAAAPAPASWRGAGPGSPFTCDVAVQGTRAQNPQAIAPNDFDLGMNFDLAATAGNNDGGKLTSTWLTDNAPNSQRTPAIMDPTATVDPPVAYTTATPPGEKSSLLQKLLSE